MKLFNSFNNIWKNLHIPLSPKQLFLAWALIGIFYGVVIVIAVVGFGALINNTLLVNMATLAGIPLALIGIILGIYALIQEKPTIPSPSKLPATSISGLPYDIFVSFAAADKDWATDLVNTLQNGPLKVRVNQLGHCAVWRDDEPRQALDILEHTATLLLILSPDWMKSSDCRKVLQNFLHLHHDPSRVLVVTRQPVELPAELRDCPVYQFGDNPGYKPASIEPRFYNQVVTLATNLANKLKAFSHPVAPPKITVFLAEVTDDLDEYRLQLKSVLEQEGCRVLPRGFSLFVEHPEKQWQADLVQAKVFIQLLSDLPGKQQLPLLQYQAAQTAKVTQILQWRDKQLNFDKVTDLQHKALLESDTVMAIGIEEFRQEVLRVIKPQEETPTDPRLLAQPIFVNGGSEDEEFVKQILHLLDKYKVHGTVPLPKGKPAEIRKDVKEKMSFCRAMVLVYGQTGLSWVNAQHRDFLKICSQTGNVCLPPLALCHLPENPEFLAAGLNRFSCTGNLEQDLTHFLKELQPHA